jgi:hypothetical protein
VISPRGIFDEHLILKRIFNIERSAIAAEFSSKIASLTSTRSKHLQDLKSLSRDSGLFAKLNRFQKRIIEEVLRFLNSDE